MCHFLFVAVPAANADRIKQAFARGFMVFPATNKSVLNALPQGFEARVVTSGGCSCDLFGKQPPDAGLRKDVRERLGELCGQAGGLAVAVHWFSGDLDAEAFKLKKVSCKCDALAGRAASLVEDELLVAR